MQGQVFLKGGGLALFLFCSLPNYAINLKKNHFHESHSKLSKNEPENIS